MSADDEARATTSESPENARQSFRSEIADAISGIIDRDHFLQRLARRAAEVTGTSRVAIYTRATTGGDLVLRSSTLPTHERIPPRISADPERARRDVTTFLGNHAGTNQHLIIVPIGGMTEHMGVLALFSEPGGQIADADQHLIGMIAEEIAPAITVAEHHHAVKQASVVDLTTGAYTNWYLTQRFDEEIARAQRTNSPITVVLVSVLGFEQLQREAGYDRADVLLRDLAGEFAGLTRVFDVVGMRSRSEFAILLPDTDIAGASTVIARVHQRAQRVIKRLRDEYRDVTVQVVSGAAAFPTDGDRVATVLLAAEHRLNESEMNHRRAAGKT
jgi:diguanylate cyclase (GGDEF)-like protein